MQYYLLSIIIIPFLLVNYKILKSDFTQKKIPNKYLLYLIYLIPFYYAYLLIFTLHISFTLFFFQILLTFIISFILYYFGIWSAGDAKYLLVLALFIPNIGIIPFVGNIALLTIGYLLGYFIWFYLGKCLFNWRYTKSLYISIYNDLKDKSLNFLKNGEGNIYKKSIFFKILKWILLFLIIFVSIRLARLYILADIKQSTYYEVIIKYIGNYTSYIIIISMLIFIGLIYIIKYIINKIKYKLVINGIKYNENYIILTLLLILITFIIYEYNKNPIEIKLYLFKIFSLYIFIYIIFKILKYSYKITFQLAEQETIKLKDLKRGEIIDRDYLIKMFGEQTSLGANGHKGILFPNPKEYFSNIENPISVKTRNELIKIYKIVNNHHKKLNGTLENNSIKILKTFAFGGYIFAGFIISFLIGNMFFQIIVNGILKIFNLHS